MQRVRLIQFGQPLRNDEVPDPSPGSDEVLVEVRAAGVCHSDVHYRAGRGRVNVPLALGHEIAGVVSAIGQGVTRVAIGDRVALHYLISCGECEPCLRSGEQFCVSGEMLGKERDGGYAEKIVVPSRNCIPIPDEVPFEQAAIMMCSTASAHHALRLAQVRPGESLAILGFGGLGVSAVQMAGLFDIERILAVDIVPQKLEMAESFGAIPIDASRSDLVKGLAGVDVALDFAGHAETSREALRALAPGGRLVLVAINLRSLQLDPYDDILAKERRIIGCSDHTREELVELMELARRGEIDLSRAITRTIPLDAEAINAVLDELEVGTSHLRTVIR